MDLNGKVVWITGASSGIGEAVAYEMATKGALLILTASRLQSLEEVADKCKKLGCTNVISLPFDLSVTDQLDTLVDNAWDIYGRIDVFYNNAGISQRGTTVETELHVIRKVMDVDFYAPVVMTKRILPKMLDNGGGQLVVTTSIAGRFGFPMRCAYSSAKHALYGFFETVSAEYHDKNIKVTIVCPGRVKTNISLNALEKDGTPHGKMDAGQAGGISSSNAARKIVAAIINNRREVLVGGKELLMVYIKRFFPGLCAMLSRNIKAM